MTYLRLFGGDNVGEDAPVRVIEGDGIERDWELKLADGRIVTWPGCCEIGAARRYEADHPGERVVATRPAPIDIVVGFRPDMIIEPGHPLWGKRVVIRCPNRCEEEAQR